MLAARYVVQSYIGTSLAAFVVGIIVNKENALWPSEIGSAYPSRPLFQIGIACSVLPYLAYIFLWWLKAKSKRLLSHGILKFSFFIASVYCTRLDNPHLHGLVGFLHTVAEILWMITICLLEKNTGKAIGYRKVIAIAYLALFCLSVHQLSRALATGVGLEEFKSLRALLLLISLCFDYLCQYEFEGVRFTIDWVASYSV